MVKDILIPAWKRLAAFVIDVLIIEFLLLYPFTNIAEKAFQSLDSYFGALPGQLIGLVFAVALIYLLYFLLFEWLLGQTIGKMLMKCSSVTLKNEKMNFWQALGRNLFLFPVIPFIFLWVLDPIMILWQKRSFSEILTKTKTVEGEKWVKSKQ